MARSSSTTCAGTRVGGRTEGQLCWWLLNSSRCSGAVCHTSSNNFLAACAHGSELRTYSNGNAWGCYKSHLLFSYKATAGTQTNLKGHVKEPMFEQSLTDRRSLVLAVPLKTRSKSLWPFSRISLPKRWRMLGPALALACMHEDESAIQGRVQTQLNWSGLTKNRQLAHGEHTTHAYTHTHSHKHILTCACAHTQALGSTQMSELGDII